ncbi:MAG: hypothetical protein IIX48_12740 [Lachnospiraceae bacterium]|nr:hypothetical protein [Lachnospiraceae bacterium]
MMIAIEIIGSAAAVITIFSAGVAVGRFINQNKNDRHKLPKTLAIILINKHSLGQTVYR